MPRWKNLILLCLLGGASTLALAQSGGLEVRVRDADSGESIAGAAVIVPMFRRCKRAMAFSRTRKRSLSPSHSSLR